MQLLRFLLPVFVVCCLTACGGKNSNSSDAAENDTSSKQPVDSATAARNEAIATLTTIKPVLDKELSLWAQSFTGFSIDSFSKSQTGKMQQEDYQPAEDLRSFYSLYKASLAYSSDSSQFIDLFSNGISLERKGKKIIAIGDVDQAVTLCNLQTKEWKRILFFGPSAGIEEAVWTSPTQFILAGMMHNDDGKSTPILLLGDTNAKTFQWFEAKNTRPESSTYESGAMKRLKIDEWE